MRGAGILLPIGSIPGGFRGAHWFVDWLVRARQSYWQVLPLNPRDSFGSPYNSQEPLAIDREYGTEKEWLELKAHANRQGIKIIGDLPYFVAARENDLFLPGLFSGAPPDLYSKKGQWWGHPLFNWETKFKENLAYFLKRLARACELYDLVRWDHFRGYVSVWAISPGRKTGREGHWLAVPGEKILAAAREKFPRRTFIAEDLGVITAEVGKLRQKFHFLSSTVMLWHKTSLVRRDSVLYTSVHDSDTVRGSTSDKTAAARFIHQGMNSRAGIFIMAMPDILNLGSSARLNYPGRAKNNWQWQVKAEDLTGGLADRIAELTIKAKRV